MQILRIITFFILLKWGCLYKTLGYNNQQILFFRFPESLLESEADYVGGYLSTKYYGYLSVKTRLIKQQIYIFVNNHTTAEFLT